MARSEHIRGTRSRAPYGYSRQGTPNQRPQSNLLAWSLTILLLSALAIVAWLFPAYVFRNPHIALNYEILRKLGKLDDLEVFTRMELPPQREQNFLTAREVYQRESGRPEDQLRVINDLQKRLYVQNFKHGEMLGYITGEFEVIASRVMGPDDFFPGVALLAKSKEFPNTILEYLLPIEGEITNPYQIGHTLKIETGLDLAVILHLCHLPQDRLSVTALSLTYAARRFPDGQQLTVEVPKKLNLRAEWPVFKDWQESDKGAAG